MEERNNNSALIAGLVAVIVLLCGALVYFLVIKDKDEAKPTEPEQQQQQTQQPEQQQTQQQSTKKGTIKYEIKKNAEQQTQLYVNGKLVGKNYYWFDKENIYDLGDLLLAGECRSNCNWYFVDATGTIVGSLGGVVDDDGTSATDNELVRPMSGSVGSVEEVKDNTIYFTDWKYSTQDGSSICQYGDNDKVYFEEKVVYEGNNKFGVPQVVSSKTAAQVMKEDARFVCE